MLVLILAASGVALYRWSSSGQMDQFIENHSDPQKTPALLSFIGGVYHAFQDTKTAAHYYRWITEKYPDYKYVAKARYQLAQCYEDNHLRDQAMEQYVILKDSFTGTTYGQLGQKKFDQTRF